MRYRIKYQTRSKVESYIAYTTAFIADLSDSYIEEWERLSTLQNIGTQAVEYAETTAKGLLANPKWEIDEITMSLSVFNTLGREVLLVYFERMYENNLYSQFRKL